MNPMLEAGFADGLSNEEAMAVLESILASRGPAQVTIATRDLERLLSETRRSRDDAPVVATGADDSAAILLPRPEMGFPYVAPETELQKALVAAWEAMLEIRGLGIQDNFFELGGNSLLLMRLVSRLTRQQGIALPLEQALEQPTIAHWSALVTQMAGNEPAPPVKAIARADRNKHRVPLLS